MHVLPARGREVCVCVCVCVYVCVCVVCVYVTDRQLNEEISIAIIFCFGSWTISIFILCK